MINCLACFVEEKSAKAMLDEILPKILPPSVEVKCIPFEGKNDLDKNLKKKLQRWQIPNTAFLVLRDQDSGDCIKVKKTLVGICEGANKPKCLVRIACRELESFYLGDLLAIENAFDLPGLAKRHQPSTP